MRGSRAECEHGPHAADNRPRHAARYRAPYDRPGLAGDAAGVRGAVPGGAGRLRGECGAARHADRPGPERAGPAVDRQRLRHHLRGLHAARRAGRRSVRPQAHLRPGAGAVHPREPGRRAGAAALAADRGAYGAGRRRRRARAGHPHDPDHVVPGRPGPYPRHRHLDGGRRRRWRGGRSGRWRAHRITVLALGVADQCAGGRAGTGGRGAVAHREPAGHRTAARCTRCAAGDRRAGAGGVRHRADRDGRLGLGVRAAAAGRGAGRDRGVPRGRGAGEGPADAAGALPAAPGLVGERRDGAGRRRDVLDVVLPVAVCAERAGLPAVAGRALLHPALAVHRPGFQDRAAA